MQSDVTRQQKQKRVVLVVNLKTFFLIKNLNFATGQTQKRTKVKNSGQKAFTFFVVKKILKSYALFPYISFTYC